MPNNRVFYASHGVSVGGTTVQGAQSVAVNTNFNLEQVFQLGRLAIYDNIQLDPDVEVTISKALDGYPTIWELATLGGSIVDNANDRCTVILGVGDDTASSLTNVSAITMTGCFVSSVNYTIPVDGNMTEEVVLIGSHKDVTGSVSAPTANPNAVVLRRQNLKTGSCVFPTEVSGKNISNITISADFGREKMYRLGEFSPFHRFVNFPLEVTVSFDVIATSHDGVEIAEVHSACTGRTVTEESISIELCDESGTTAYTFDLGDKCQRSTVNYSGGDTGGGNATITYTYITYNDLSIT